MKHNGTSFPMREANDWFEGVERYIPAAKNEPEIGKRLTWLSEGSLLYHMTMSREPEGFVSGNGLGCPRQEWEKRLYREFIDYLRHRKSKVPVPGVWYSVINHDMDWPERQRLKVRGHCGSPDPLREDWTYYSLCGYHGDFMIRGDPAQWRLPTDDETRQAADTTDGDQG